MTLTWLCLAFLLVTVFCMVSMAPVGVNAMFQPRLWAMQLRGTSKHSSNRRSLQQARLQNIVVASRSGTVKSIKTYYSAYQEHRQTVSPAEQQQSHQTYSELNKNQLDVVGPSQAQPNPASETRNQENDSSRRIKYENSRKINAKTSYNAQSTSERENHSSTTTSNNGYDSSITKDVSTEESRTSNQKRLRLKPLKNLFMNCFFSPVQCY